MNQDLIDFTRKMNKNRPCFANVIRYLVTHDDTQTAWDECVNGQWMLWLLNRVHSDLKSPERRKFTLVACECARMHLEYAETGSPIEVIELAEKWAQGNDNLPEGFTKACNRVYDEASKVHSDHSEVAFAAFNAASTARFISSAYQSITLTYKHNHNYKLEGADIIRKHYPKMPDWRKI